MLTQGKYALVDAKYFDYINQWNWCFNGRYAVRKDGKKTVLMHRVIAERAGLDIKGKEVDHINRNGIDNLLENLRPATASENRRNTGKHRNNTSGYKGVCFDRKSRLWTAKIRFNGKQINLGSFPTAEQAAAEYDKAAVKYHGKFAVLNNVHCEYVERHKQRKSERQSGFRGVTWNKQCGKWRVTVKGKHIGYFTDKIEAAKAYNKAAKKLLGKNAYQNKV